MNKIAILGAGFIGNTHALCYKNIDRDFKIAAVADVDEEKAKKLAGEFNARYYTSSEELLKNEDMNIVDVCLPTFLHKKYAVKALKMGCNVFCEKPITLDLAQGREIIQAAAESRGKIMVGHCIRFWPEYLLLKEYIDNKKFGNLLSIVFTRLSSKRKKGLAWKEWIFDEKFSGSAAIDLHIHDIDFTRYILGEPDSIQSSVYYNLGQPEHIFSNLRFGDVLINTEASWAYPTGSVPFKMAYRAMFEKGVITFDVNEKEQLKVFDAESGGFIKPEVVYPPIEPIGTGGNVPAIYGYVNELEYFLDCVEKGKKIEVATAEEAYKSLALTMKIFKKAKKNL